MRILISKCLLPLQVASLMPLFFCLSVEERVSHVEIQSNFLAVTLMSLCPGIPMRVIIKCFAIYLLQRHPTFLDNLRSEVPTILVSNERLTVGKYMLTSPIRYTLIRNSHWGKFMPEKDVQLFCKKKKMNACYHYQFTLSSLHHSSSYRRHEQKFQERYEHKQT